MTINPLIAKFLREAGGRGGVITFIGVISIRVTPSTYSRITSSTEKLAAAIFKSPPMKSTKVVRLKTPKKSLFKLETLPKWRPEIFPQDSLRVWHSCQAAYNLLKMATQVKNRTNLYDW